MAIIMRFIFFFSLIFFTACVKNEFNLDFNLSKEVRENYDVTYYATDVKGGVTVQAVASVRDGICMLKGVTKRPTLVYLYTRKSSWPLVIYANRGEKIEISGEGTDPMKWNVEGNQINTEISEWRKSNFSFFQENNIDSVNFAVKEFVENNKENPVSLILLQCYYQRNVNEREYNELMGNLKGKAKDIKWLHLTARADNLYHRYFYPARLESLILRSDKDGADTLKINYRDPVMLLFWQNGYSDRTALMDSVKLLEKEYPDSIRLIADVCLDVDSITWKASLKKDSLDKVKRFWAPAGFNDLSVIKFQVPDLPYFIVFNSQGEQGYRGENIEEALKAYRKLMAEEDSVAKEK